MFVPYVTAVPQIFPVYPTGNLPMGLSHAGIQPIYGGGTLGWINPLQQSYGYGYGYRPVSPLGYGYGLSHAGYGYENAYANPMAYGNAYGHTPYGYGYPAPVSPVAMYGAPGISPLGMQSPLQPNWSPITQPQQQA